MNLHEMETSMMERMSAAIARGDFDAVPTDAYSQSMALSMGLVLIAILLFVLRAEFLAPDETDWKPNGRDSMRRRTRGKWEYREMTQDEYDDWFDRNAW